MFKTLLYQFSHQIHKKQPIAAFHTATSNPMQKINNPQKLLMFNQHSCSFPALPVLEEMRKKIELDAPQLENYFFITGQHCLSTTGSLFEWFRDTLKLQMSRTYLVSKTYSNSLSVLQKMKTLKLHYQPSTKQLTLGGFPHHYDTDVVKLYDKFFSHLKKALKRKENIKGIIVMDDGGHLFTKMPSEMLSLKNAAGQLLPVVGIEQTSSGIGSSSVVPYPIIEVASSAAKQLEAPFVAKVIKEQLDRDLLAQGLTSEQILNLCYGIAGFGNIGRALFDCLQSSGYKNIIIFDKDKKSTSNITMTPTIPEFIKKAEVILGCTGVDFMKEDFIQCLEIIREQRNFPKIFASASSKDVEFNSLLIDVQRNNRNGSIDPLKDISYPKKNPDYIILAGGMPLNFKMVNQENRDHSVPLEEIQLTRGLLAAAVLQAHQMIETNQTHTAEQHGLDPKWQKFVVETWCRAMNRPMIQSFEDLNWISLHSQSKILNKGKLRM